MEGIDYFGTTSLLLCTLVIILFLNWIRGYFKSRNLPPGPTGWPLLGFLPRALMMSFQGMSQDDMKEWLRKTYGPVSSVSLLGQRVVLVSGYRQVHGVLNRHDLNARNAHGSIEAQSGVKPRYQTGVILSSGDLWKMLRKFSLTTLRGLGIGKKSFEEQIAIEAENLLQELSSTKGSPYDPTQILCNSVSNVICSVVFGKRFEYDDPKFQEFLDMLDEKTRQPLALIISISFPRLWALPFGPVKRHFDDWTTIREHIREIVEEHAASFDPDNPRDFIDAYLNEIRNNETTEQEGGSANTKIFADNIFAVIDDLFGAGTDTTSTTLRWGLLLMMKYPQIQERVQREIDSIVGRNRLPRLSDRPDLPYTEAVLHEIQRIGSIVPMTGPRYASENTTFEGFEIPKGSFLIPNLYSTTRDPSVWKDPDDFNPDRFLDNEGRFSKPQELIVFGSGRRVCLGEQLARMELYIFFTYLVHRFTFCKRRETDILNLKPKVTIVMEPHPYELRAVERD